MACLARKTMVLTISKKLVLAFLGLTVVVLVSTLGLARWSFEQGFLDYVNALEEKRLEPLALQLALEYRKDGDSWSALTEQRFRRLLREQTPELDDDVARIGRANPLDFPRPGPPEDERPPIRRGPPDEGHPPTGHPPRLGPPTALFSGGQLIAGLSFPTTESKPISVPIVVEGKRVGELRSAPRRHFDSPQETAFSRQQWLTSGVIGLVALLMAVATSMLLTRILLAPIRCVLTSISRLSKGDYSARLNKPRKDELGQLMSGLDRLAHKLEESQTARKRWLADISHELRTPLTVLTGEIEAMKDGIRSLDMKQIHSLDQEVLRLRSLIDDLYELSISDIGGLRYSFDEVNIRDSVTAAVDAVTARASEKSIEITVRGETDKMSRADSQRLDQLFVNLLENSLAYTDSPGKIEIYLLTSKEGLVVNIQDSTPGVNADECEKLFEPLYRHENSRSRRTAGAGLGLAICRNIVDAHHGSIVASPSELGGLCVRILLPTH